MECRLGTASSEHLGFRSGTRGGSAQQNADWSPAGKKTLYFGQLGPNKREMGIKGSLKKS